MNLNFRAASAAGFRTIRSRFDTRIGWRVYTPQNGSCSVITVNERSRIRKWVSKNWALPETPLTGPA
jgi:hypothetical protein